MVKFFTAGLKFEEGDSEIQEAVSGNKEPEDKEPKVADAENENDSGEDDMFEADDFEIKAVERVVQRTSKIKIFLAMLFHVPSFNKSLDILRISSIPLSTPNA